MVLFNFVFGVALGAEEDIRIQKYIVPGETPPTWVNISGIQGRYFIPIAPLGFMLLSNRWLAIKSRVNRIAISSANFVSPLSNNLPV